VSQGWQLFAKDKNFFDSTGQCTNCYTSPPAQISCLLRILLKYFITCSIPDVTTKTTWEMYVSHPAMAAPELTWYDVTTSQEGPWVSLSARLPSPLIKPDGTSFQYLPSDWRNHSAPSTVWTFGRGQGAGFHSHKHDSGTTAKSPCVTNVIALDSRRCIVKEIPEAARLRQSVHRREGATASTTHQAFRTPPVVRFQRANSRARASTSKRCSLVAAQASMSGFRSGSTPLRA
jgi:hypothetical protein